MFSGALDRGGPLMCTFRPPIGGWTPLQSTTKEFMTKALPSSKPRPWTVTYEKTPTASMTSGLGVNLRPLYLMVTFCGPALSGTKYAPTVPGSSSGSTT
ncbi:hypothetical protein TYRP_015180 [Tyrophagus putrescentiae]|nr:hypothetical protein TYRP_015180 [Tyrophagus putrescentiae]